MSDARVRRRRFRPGPAGRGSRVEAADGLGELVDLLGGESQRSRRFLGGIVLGALVGAAVAGSSLVRQRKSGR
jgi:hypothetical protein